MAQGQTEVANRALAKLGLPRVTSLDEDTQGATEIREAWTGLRQVMFRTHPWKFAITRRKLPADATAPDFGFLRRYLLPKACMRVLQVGIEPGYPPRYEIEAGFVLTDAEAPLAVRYVFDEPNVAAWDPAFAEAFAARIAMELVERVTGSGTKRQLAVADYQEQIRIARRCQAIESQAQNMTGGEPWLESRV